MTQRILLGLLMSTALCGIAAAQPASFVNSQSGSVTAPGTSGTAAQGVQGVVNGVPFPVTGTVSLSNGTTVNIGNSSLPVTQSGPWSVGLLSSANTVTIGNTTVNIGGTVTLGTGTASIGTVGVSSLPALPAGTNSIGSVTVSNFPTTQAVSGSVSVSNLPVTQTVAGTVAVSNLPATQAITGSATSLNQTGSLTDASATLGTSAALVVPAGIHHAVILEINSAGGTVGCSWTSATPTIFGAGTVTYQGQGQGFTAGFSGPGFVPSQALYCIAAAASTSITVQYN